eukprot:2930681-Alexandrium_andersonii.AAC.1
MLVPIPQALPAPGPPSSSARRRGPRGLAGRAIEVVGPAGRLVQCSRTAFLSAFGVRRTGRP